MMPRQPAKSATSTIFSIQTLASPLVVLLFLVFVNSVNFNKSDTSKPSKHLRLSVPGRSLGQLPCFWLQACLLMSVPPFMLEFVMFLEWGVVKVLSIWFHMVFASCLELALPTVLDHLTWSQPVITLCTWAQWSKCRQRAWCVLVLSCVWLDSKLQSQDWRPAY